MPLSISTTISIKNASDKLLATEKTKTTEEIISWQRSGRYETKMTLERPETLAALHLSRDYNITTTKHQVLVTMITALAISRFPPEFTVTLLKYQSLLSSSKSAPSPYSIPHCPACIRTDLISP